MADPAVRNLLPDETGWPDTPFGRDPAAPADRKDAADRLLFAQAIAALTALFDGVVATEEECDLASVIGAGHPPHTGGAIRLIRGIGIDAFAARAAALGTRCGPRFDVPQAALDQLRRTETRAA